VHKQKTKNKHTTKHMQTRAHIRTYQFNLISQKAITQINDLTSWRASTQTYYRM